MPDIRLHVQQLFTVLAASQVNYVLVGGVALLVYVDGRNTQDVDLILAPQEVARLPWQGYVRDRDFGQAEYAGVQIDLLLTSNPLFAYVAQRERTTVEFDGREIVCATRTGLILLKLYALPSLYRQQNFARVRLYEADLGMLLDESTEDSEAFLAILRQHLAPADIDELRKILTELRRGPAGRFYGSET